MVRKNNISSQHFLHLYILPFTINNINHLLTINHISKNEIKYIYHHHTILQNKTPLYTTKNSNIFKKKWNSIKHEIISKHTKDNNTTFTHNFQSKNFHYSTRNTIKKPNLPSCIGSMVWIISCRRPCLNLCPPGGGAPGCSSPGLGPAPAPVPTDVSLDVAALPCCNC